MDDLSIPPRPVPDALTAAYWDGAAKQQLMIQRCRGCQLFHHPPVSRCPACGGERLEAEPVSGAGAIHSFTVTHDARTPAFRARQPYAVVWVELDEQAGLIVIANMPGVPVGEVRIGRRVSVWFEEIDAGVWLPQFRLGAEPPSA